MKHRIITCVLFLSFGIFAQDSNSVYNKKLNQLRSELGIAPDAEFDNIAYGLLVKKLDSLGIKDDQLDDGYEWGGGKIGFEVYLQNNIDRLLSDFKLSSLPSDGIKKEGTDIPVDSTISLIKQPIEIDEDFEPVTGLVIKKTLDKIRKPGKKKDISKTKSNKKSMFSGLRIGSGQGKTLLKGTSFSEHTSFFEPILSVRTPLGIGIGPVHTSLGYESSNYSFEAPEDTLTSYFGSGSGPALFFDISKIIKIGGENLGKYFMLGMSTYEHGSGFFAGYDVNMFVGSLPVSLSVSSRMNIISLDTGGTTYWISGYAGLGVDIR